MTKDSSEDKPRLKCSFCGKTQEMVKKLIAGPGVYICDECVDLCNEILREEGVAIGTGEIGRLKGARNEILSAAITQSDSWIVKRSAESSKGVQVFVQNNPLGTTIEEKVLYASALEDLVKDGCLQQCTNETYQVTWKGLIESRRADKQPTNATVDELLLVDQLTPEEQAELRRKLKLKLDNKTKGSSTEKEKDS